MQEIVKGKFNVLSDFRSPLLLENFSLKYLCQKRDDLFSFLDGQEATISDDFKSHIAVNLYSMLLPIVSREKFLSIFSRLTDVSENVQREINKGCSLIDRNLMRSVRKNNSQNPKYTYIAFDELISEVESGIKRAMKYNSSDDPQINVPMQINTADFYATFSFTLKDQLTVGTKTKRCLADLYVKVYYRLNVGPGLAAMYYTYYLFSLMLGEILQYQPGTVEVLFESAILLPSDVYPIINACEKKKDLKIQPLSLPGSKDLTYLSSMSSEALKEELEHSLLFTSQYTIQQEISSTKPHERRPLTYLTCAIQFGSGKVLFYTCSMIEDTKDLLSSDVWRMEAVMMSREDCGRLLLANIDLAKKLKIERSEKTKQYLDLLIKNINKVNS